MEYSVFWEAVIEAMKQLGNVNDRACVLQNAIAIAGPVPDTLGEKIREALSNG